MLHQGNTKSKKENVFKTLERADYRIIPATVIPTDFEFNHVLIQAEQEEGLLEPLKELYLAHFIESLEYSEAQSDRVFGRQIPHILRLHSGIATASFFEEVIRLLKERGYHFINVKEALSDPAFLTEEEYIGPLGLTFIDRVAATQGKEFNPDAYRITRKQIRKQLGIR